MIEFPKTTRTSHFDQYYNNLNAEQKAAVDQTEGPVMVIAGPGTGKTQILAVRIAKILLQPDISAHNILCLTYTDAATIAMRKRLVKIIGPEGHRIHIFSFHAFCNKVIQDNLEYFGNYRQLEPITDLESIEIYNQLISALPNEHILKPLKRDPQIEIARLKNLFSLMKKENYTAEDIKVAIEKEKEGFLANEDNYYKRNGKGYKKGDIKQRDFDKLIRQTDLLQAGADLFDTFQNLMKEAGRYDFDDMIQWVVRGFEDNQDLLADYQEQYHYFLIDEFQDTNGSQKRIIDLLVSFWGDAANVFVVGDDDQAIYKFQGANLDNIKSFKNQYDPGIVVLTKNYRSNQHILDGAKQLIESNAERIVNEPDFPLDKNIVAEGRHKLEATKISINIFCNISQEQAHIARILREEYQAGKDISKTAILYRKHSQVEKLTEVLEGWNIPMNMKRRIDILKLPLIQNILQILEFINESYKVKGYTDRTLFEIMHFNFFNISSHDIAKLTWETRQQEDREKYHTPLTTLIGNKTRLQKLDLASYDAIVNLYELLDKWVADVNDVTLQVLFQNVINQGGILEHILQKPDKSWQLQVIATLFDLIKEETTKKPDLKLHEFMTMIDAMKLNQLPLAVNKIVSSNNGVHFLTAHGSKGLEFERVFVIGLSEDIWDKSRGRSTQFSYPSTLNGDAKNSIEDERRLVFVAMTRAERELIISYSDQKENGKDLSASKFISEIENNPSVLSTRVEVSEDVTIAFQAEVLRRTEKDAPIIDHDVVNRKLEGYKLSVTALNKYLDCPVTFYFEAMLQVPMARTKYLGFGRGVHHALESFYKRLNEGEKISPEQFLLFFAQGMSGHRAHFTDKEYVDMMAYGEKTLNEYYKEHLTIVPPAKGYATEISIDNIEVDGIPIKGILDLVTIHDGEVLVTDFKTGNPNSQYNRPKLKPGKANESIGGDYWRQIVFYKLLCDADPKYRWNMLRGVMDFVEPDKNTGKFTKKEYVPSPEELTLVKHQIKQTWEDIHEHKFTEGCNKEECKWCSFLTRLKA